MFSDNISSDGGISGDADVLKGSLSFHFRCMINYCFIFTKQTVYINTDVNFAHFINSLFCILPDIVYFQDYFFSDFPFGSE